MITVEDNLDIMPMTFTDKKVLVVGLARSGVGAANLLSCLGAHVSVSDSKPRSMLESQIGKLPSSVDVITEGNLSEASAGAEIIVISPGVPGNIPHLQYAREKGIPVISEIELAFQVVNSIASVPFIGITGTNGKSTVTTLVDLMLKESGIKTLLGGNIGNALTEEIQNIFFKDGQISVEAAPDYIVAEISSFQLEAIQEFKPEIAAVLNISPDHLDRYNSMEEYIHAKAEIFSNQTAGDYLIVNADDPVVMEVCNNRMNEKGTDVPDVVFFSREGEVKGVYEKEGMMYLHMPDYRPAAVHVPLLSIEELRIKGAHNIENALASSLISFMAGSQPDDVKNVLQSFQGLEHRLEFVKELNGITFINDSKGTNVGAVAKSLESFEHLILIMGGTDKGSDFSILREQMKRKVKTLILIGEAGDKIGRSLGDTADTYKVEDLKKAVELSMSKASRGDTVLLSPGCASFDMFENFEERGNEFKKAVREIAD